MTLKYKNMYHQDFLGSPSVTRITGTKHKRRKLRKRHAPFKTLTLYRIIWAQET